MAKDFKNCQEKQLCITVIRLLKNKKKERKEGMNVQINKKIGNLIGKEKEPAGKHQDRYLLSNRASSKAERTN